MIFVTVGTQLPFDRLVKAVDAWCLQNTEVRVFAQIGDPGHTGYLPKSMAWKRFLTAAEVDHYFSTADLIVSHAGMGSIISAMALPRRILVLPRRATLNEQRNDHQYATARKLEGRPNVFVAWSESEIGSKIEAIRSMPRQHEMSVAPHAQESLIKSVRRFIETGR